MAIQHERDPQHEPVGDQHEAEQEHRTLVERVAKFCEPSLLLVEVQQLDDGARRRGEREHEETSFAQLQRRAANVRVAHAGRAQEREQQREEQRPQRGFEFAPARHCSERDREHGQQGAVQQRSWQGTQWRLARNGSGNLRRHGSLIGALRAPASGRMGPAAGCGRQRIADSRAAASGQPPGGVSHSAAEPRMREGCVAALAMRSTSLRR